MKKRTSILLATTFVLLTTVVYASPAEALETSIHGILGVLQWLGFIVGIGMALVIGIKYLTAGAGAKASVKSSMLPWLFGAFCVALAPAIATAVFNAFYGS